MVESPACVHHWVVESPAPGKKILEGVCKNCHSNKEFKDPFNESFLESRINPFNQPLPASSRPIKLSNNRLTADSYE